ncbi:MAG: isoprenylcysteine carboxylmethyltransferase family protein [Chloroflexi bacterium]|nr:isoprenylcysteine carboxylmethyltransferase family protein [Chloroflexota bacterium]
MCASNIDTPLDPSRSRGGPAARWIVRTVLGGLVMAAILFLAAGTAAWPGAWIYLGGLLAPGLLTPLVVDPGLLAERMTRRHPDQKPWDRILFGLYGLVNGLVVPIIAGLDRRYAWSPALPGWWTWVALLVFAGGWAVNLWAMAANKYFAEVVRLQLDRGQTVVSSGPYLHVRHPGYLGGMLVLLSCPFLLGSLWALSAAIVGTSLLVVRTALEDRMLQAELPGYAEYAAKVRYRLLPGIW